MQKIFFYCYFVCITLLFLIGSILSVSSITQDFSIHEAPYDMVAISGLSESELNFAFKDTVHYLYDNREVLNTTLQDKPLFNQKEIKHMKEVKSIFQALIFTFWILLCLVIFLTYIAYKKIKVTDSLKWLQKAIRHYFWAVFIFFIFLGMSLFFFFDPIFIFFHQIVFQNDDWLFSLSSDHLIQFLPEQFFLKRALQIALAFTLLHISGTIVAKKMLKRHISKQH